jgi:hypothetical protein
MVNYDKPLGISLLAYLLMLMALIIISTAIYVFFYESEFWDIGLLHTLNSRVQRLLVIMSFAVLIFVSAIGLLKTSPGGRRLLLLLCLVTIIHGVSVASSDIPRGLVIMVVCATVAIFMLNPSISIIFQPMDSRKAVEAIHALESYRRGRSLK